MARHYRRKSDKGKVDPEAMKSAMDAVMRNQISYKKAANSFKAFNVPQSTLEQSQNGQGTS